MVTGFTNRCVVLGSSRKQSHAAQQVLDAGLAAAVAADPVPDGRVVTEQKPDQLHQGSRGALG